MLLDLNNVELCWIPPHHRSTENWFANAASHQISRRQMFNPSQKSMQLNKFKTTGDCEILRWKKINKLHIIISKAGHSYPQYWFEKLVYVALISLPRSINPSGIDYFHLHIIYMVGFFCEVSRVSSYNQETSPRGILIEKHTYIWSVQVIHFNSGLAYQLRSAY